MTKDDWFYSYVSDLSQNNVINGYPDGTFKPNNTVTVGEALKLIMLAAGYGEQAPTGSHWASGYLRLASSKGFANYGTYSNLDAEINRLTVAQLAAKALCLPKSNIVSPFKDSDDGYVLSLYSAGIVQGSTDGGALLYYPLSSIKRSEVSAVIWRIRKSLSAPKTIQYGSHTLDVLKNVPVNEYISNCFYTSNGKICYDPTKMKTYSGVDVSSYQGTIDWKKVKASGIDFAIIRLGYRGYETGSVNLDSYFEKNIQGATAAGLEVGVYFFSQAISVSEAVQEANFVLSYIKKYNITYPVVFDWELIGASSARTNNVSTETLCSAANAFCKTVSDAGYTPMIYFNSYCGYLSYDLSKVMNNDFWLAEYSAKPSFYYNFQMWQYTSKGSVNGISGNVDMNISFKAF